MTLSCGFFSAICDLIVHLGADRRDHFQQGLMRPLVLRGKSQQESQVGVRSRLAAPEEEDFKSGNFQSVR